MFSTSPAGYELIRRFEGCRLTAYKIAGDPYTVGWGLTGAMPDGRPVVEGLTITQAEADDALYWFVHNITDPLVRKHFNARTQEEHDALASWVYNLSTAKLEAGKYSLPNFVNMANRDLNAVIDKWVQYVNPGTVFEQGLFRRRLAEICLFLGLPWHFALTAVLKRKNGVITARTDPYYVIDMAELAAQKTEDEITADANLAQWRKLGGKGDPPPAPSAKPVTASKAAPVSPAPKAAEPAPAPPVDVSLPPKKIEESKTGKAITRADRGKETTIIGTVTGTGVAAAAANAEKVGAVIERFKPETFMIMGGAFCLFLIVMGAVMWWHGWAEAKYRRQYPQDPKY